MGAVECAVNVDGDAAVFLSGLPATPYGFVVMDDRDLGIKVGAVVHVASVSPECAKSAAMRCRLLVVEFDGKRKIRRETWVPLLQKKGRTPA